MNWLHLQAFCWLRWRLSVNQWRRGGKLNAVLMTLLAAAALALAVPLAIACFVVGLLVFPEASPAQLMYTWDAVVIGLLFFWSIGVLTELQRSDSLTLSKFMHLPVSVQGAFLINYLSSLVRLTTVVFVPVLAGLGLALVFTRRRGGADGAAGHGGFPADGHGRDVPVSGMAGIADEQSAPPADGGRAGNHGLRADLSATQPAQLLRRFRPAAPSAPRRRGD